MTCKVNDIYFCIVSPSNWRFQILYVSDVYIKVKIIVEGMAEHINFFNRKDVLWRNFLKATELSKALYL